nr:MAG: RNA-dependent RNA polymerase [Riboviria sp.]
MHTLAMRARTWSFTHDVRLPSDLPQIIARVINRAAAINLAMHDNIDVEKVHDSNRMLDTFQDKTNTGSIWLRWAGAIHHVASKTVTTFRYVKPLGLPSLDAMCKTTTARIRGGARALLRTFAYSRIVEHQTLVNNRGIVPLPTCVPSATWENQLTSIVTRALPQPQTVDIDPKITEWALHIARMIGPIPSALPFNEWLERYPPQRRKQLEEAALQPIKATVDMFHKIEQLDEDKDPRAIQARHDTYKTRLGPWMAAFEERCKENLPFLVKGLDENARADRLAAKRARALNVVEIDYSRFDKHCSLKLLENTEHLIYEHCFPPAVNDLIRQQRVNVCKTIGGAQYTVVGTRMSGDMNTSIGNCLVNACLSAAAGIPLDSLLVEGDDMIAFITNEERDRLNIDLISRAGQKPKLRLNPADGGSFCSRYDVITINGPKRVRHPLRDLRRYGWTLHNENPYDAAMRHYLEWKGVPMLGPVYEKKLQDLGANIETTRITAEARAKFHSVSTLI